MKTMLLAAALAVAIGSGVAATPVAAGPFGTDMQSLKDTSATLADPVRWRRHHHHHRGLFLFIGPRFFHHHHNRRHHHHHRYW